MRHPASGSKPRRKKGMTKSMIGGMAIVSKSSGSPRAHIKSPYTAPIQIAAGRINVKIASVSLIAPSLAKTPSRFHCQSGNWRPRPLRARRRTSNVKPSGNQNERTLNPRIQGKTC